MHFERHDGTPRGGSRLVGDIVSKNPTLFQKPETAVPEGISVGGEFMESSQSPGLEPIHQASGLPFNNDFWEID
jgi:hypothetical protein